MIANVYFTDGMFEWGKLFMKSFNKFHPDIDIIAVTRNLNNNQIEELSKYALIENAILPYEKMAKKINVSIDRLLQMKKEVETGQTNDSNQPWKWLIAGGDRIESLYEIVKLYDHVGVLHFDADTYIRNKIDGLFDMVKKYDVCMRQRPNDPEIIRRAVISIMGFKGKNGVAFMERWLYHLRRVDLLNTTKTFDQRTCYQTVLDLNEHINIGNMREEEDYPIISVSEEEEADMWFGNCGHRGEKINKFWRDHEKKMGSTN